MDVFLAPLVTAPQLKTKMSAPPPPPGPPPPPPPSSRPFEDNDEGSDSGNRNALLNQIQGGLKLKKTVTNDRSAPVLESK